MIGVYGGTFDPVHFGHLRPAIDVMTELGLEQIRLLPCGLPAHRTRPVATAQQRQAMLELAIQQQPDWVVDTRELHREGVSYMVDTLKSLHAETTPDNATPFCLIIGMDAFVRFSGWKDWQDILQQIPLVVTHRPGYELDEALTALAKPELKDYVSRYRQYQAASFSRTPPPAIYFCAVTQLDISSTRIRSLVKTGKSISYLVPDAVAGYIRQQHLYE